MSTLDSNYVMFNYVLINIGPHYPCTLFPEYGPYCGWTKRLLETLTSLVPPWPFDRLFWSIDINSRVYDKGFGLLLGYGKFSLWKSIAWSYRCFLLIISLSILWELMWYIRFWMFLKTLLHKWYGITQGSLDVLIWCAWFKPFMLFASPRFQPFLAIEESWRLKQNLEV